MKLFDFYKAWERELMEEVLFIDLKTKIIYNIFNIPKAMWNKEVNSFWFNDNKLIVRIN